MNKLIQNYFYKNKYVAEEFNIYKKNLEVGINKITSCKSYKKSLQ